MRLRSTTARPSCSASTSVSDALTEQSELDEEVAEPLARGGLLRQRLAAAAPRRRARGRRGARRAADRCGADSGSSASRQLLASLLVRLALLLRSARSRRRDRGRRSAAGRTGGQRLPAASARRHLVGKNRVAFGRVGARPTGRRRAAPVRRIMLGRSPSTSWVGALVGVRAVVGCGDVGRRSRCASGSGASFTSLLSAPAEPRSCLRSAHAGPFPPGRWPPWSPAHAS